MSRYELPDARTVASSPPDLDTAAGTSDPPDRPTGPNPATASGTADRVTALVAQLHAASDALPASCESHDATGSVLVQIDAAGHPTRLHLTDQWPATLYADQLPAAFREAYEQALKLHQETWAANLKTTNGTPASGNTQSRGSQASQGPISSPPPTATGSPEVEVGELLEAALAGLRQARSDLRSATVNAPEDSTGTGSSRAFVGTAGTPLPGKAFPVTVRLTATGFAGVELDPDWVATRPIAAVNDTLDQALAAAQAARDAASRATGPNAQDPHRGLDTDRLLAGAVQLLASLSGPTGPEAPGTEPDERSTP